MKKIKVTYVEQELVWRECEGVIEVPDDFPETFDEILDEVETEELLTDALSDLPNRVLSEYGDGIDRDWQTLEVLDS